MSIRRRVLQTLRVFHDSLSALGEHASETSGHLVQIRDRLHKQANTLQTLDTRTIEMAARQVTRGDIAEMHRLLKELVEQGRTMQKHILKDHDEHGERLLALERAAGIR